MTAPVKRSAPVKKVEPAVLAVKKREIKAKAKEHCFSGRINVMLAQTYQPDRHDPSGWLMSEKLDGVRCFWNGTTLFSRNGVKIRAPKEWVAMMPPIALDGELWTGRDDFHRAVTITIHREHGMDEWKNVKYMVFDAPLVPGTFEQRIAVAKTYINQKPNKTVHLIKQTKCKSASHLESSMDSVCGGKGEGMMVKDPNSDYDRKRSYSLLKVKRFDDAEATVIGHVKGTGRLWNSLGAL